MVNELESRSIVPTAPLPPSAAMSTPPTSPQASNSNSELSTERSKARAEAHTRTTVERGPTPLDTTMRNRWYARRSCLTDQFYKRRLENLVRRKDSSYHRLVHETRQEQEDIRVRLATADTDAAAQRRRIDELTETELELRYQMRFAEESRALDDVLSTPQAYVFREAGGFGDGALLQTGSLEDPFVPVSSESTLPQCMQLL